MSLFSNNSLTLKSQSESSVETTENQNIVQAIVNGASESRLEHYKRMLDGLKIDKIIKKLRWFNIIGASGLCIAVTQNSGKLTQQKCGNSNHLLWTGYNSNGYYIIKNKNGQFMDNYHDKRNNGNPVFASNQSKSGSQLWVMYFVQNEKYVHIKTPGTKCFDDRGKAYVNSSYQIWSCSKGNRNQWFRLAAPGSKPKNKPVSAPKGWFNIIGKTGLCVAVTQNKGKLTQQNCGNANHLLWTTEKYKNGFIIKNKNGQVMDNYYGRGHNENPVVGWDQANNSAQTWVIESVQNGNHVHFRNLQRNKCFDDREKAYVNSTYVIYDCRNGNRNQWFRLEAPKA